MGNDKPKIAVYGGTFDPPTLGHLDVIKRASILFDKLYVVELVNENKEPMFPRNFRFEMLKAMVSGVDGVEVVQSDGLLTAFAYGVGASYSVRGVRNGFDTDYERPMFEFNAEVAKTEYDNFELDTIFIPTTRKNFDTSSSNIRTLILNKAYKTASKYLDENVMKMIMDNLEEKK